MITSSVGIETMNAPVLQTTNYSNVAELVEEHANFLYRFAIRRVRDESAAEDLVQETLLAVLKSSDGFLNRSSERTWLTSILKNKIVDHFRKTAREETFDFSGDEEFFQADGHWKTEFAASAWNAKPNELVENREFWEIINRCLAKLPKQTAAAFILREIEGLSSDEVCEALNISANNLWTMLHRARVRLRSEIEVNFFSRN